MQISVNPAANTGRRSHALQERFDKLCGKLQRQEGLNQRLAADLDSLAGRYVAVLRETDERHLDALSALAERLIDFFSRKSLSNWERDELGEWIVEVIKRIERVDAGFAERLGGRFRSVLADHLGLTEEEFEAHSAKVAETIEAAFEEGFARDGQEEAPGFEGRQADLFEDLFGEAEDGGRGCGGPEDDGDGEACAQRLMDGDWVRGLFRRAAQALHPDREPDPAERRRKQERMQQLLAARKAGDILALLRLHAEAIGGGELVLGEAQMRQACEWMQERLARLREERDAIRFGDPLRALVYELFYHRSRKVREQRFEAWRREWEAEAEAGARLGRLRNLRALKGVLAERREQRMFMKIADIVGTGFSMG